jgi:hypothetical protein
VPVSMGARQRARFEFNVRYRSVRARVYLDGRLRRPSIGTFADFGLDESGAELVLSARRRASLRNRMDQAWLAARDRTFSLIVTSGAASSGNSRGEPGLPFPITASIDRTEPRRAAART